MRARNTFSKTSDVCRVASSSSASSVGAPRSLRRAILACCSETLCSTCLIWSRASSSSGWKCCTSKFCSAFRRMASRFGSRLAVTNVLSARIATRSEWRMRLRPYGCSSTSFSFPQLRVIDNPQSTRDAVPVAVSLTMALGCWVDRGRVSLTALGESIIGAACLVKQPNGPQPAR